MRLRKGLKWKIVPLSESAKFIEEDNFISGRYITIAFLKCSGLPRDRMGVPTEIWRARIEGYHPGLHRARFAMAPIRLQNKRPGVHLLLAFVMIYVVLPHTTRPQSMFTTDFSGVSLEVGPCSYLDNGQCMGDMTGARIGTALLDQESLCLFST